MKRFLMLLALMGLAATMWAVPAKRGVTKTVMGADGQEMTVTLRGDESFHYYVNSDGTPVCEQADGTWAEDMRDVKALWSAARAKRNYNRPQLAERMRRAMKAPRRVGESTGATGTKKGLLILVNFKDKTMVNGSKSKDIFDQMLNAIGNPYGQNYGSVREYFRAQSYGQFDIEFDVVGPVTVSQNMSYYGANQTEEEGSDKAAAKMVKEACQLANSDVNFSDYDWDGDGEVENIYVTYAGYGEADGGDSNTIWPHQWDLTSAKIGSLTLDGVKINTYACGAELKDGKGSTLSGIGTMCHEYSHCLGLPDFYDIDYSGGHGMFDWDIMDGGSYNGDGFCPVGYTAYERWFSGWLTPVELNSACNVSGMKAIEDEPEAYIVYNDGNRNEYYMLANHQQKGWNKAEAGKGMLIIHVDYDKDVWAENGPNDDHDHQRVTIIPADNQFNYETYQGTKYYYANDGDTWPGSTNNTAFTDTSTPKAELYNVNTDGTYLMHKPIENITEDDGLISFRFMGGVALEVPMLDEATDITATSFQVAWSAVEDAASYNLKLTEKNKDVVPTSYIKLTEKPDNWEGQYLIVYEDGKVAMNGGLTDKLDAVGNTIGVTISNGEIVRTAVTDAASFTINMLQSGNFSIKGRGGLYMGQLSNSNGLQSSSSTIYANSLSFIDGEATIIGLGVTAGGGAYLRYNKADDQGRFRYYKSSTYTNQEPIALYKAQVIVDIVKDISGITDTQYTFTGLSPETQYTVQVQTVDSEGNTSAWSEVISFTTLAEETIYALGDVNKDGEVSIADVTKLVNLILTDAEYSKEADVNGDGEIGIADVTALVNIILGKSTPTGR